MFQFITETVLRASSHVNHKKVDTLTSMPYTFIMYDMAREPAEWRKHMTDREREELALAERVRDAAADQLRALTSRMKARCIKRMLRAKDG